jgi:hypothetical protein
MIDPVVSVSLRCLLAVLFATAAWHKASDSRRFTATLDAYRLLPPWLGGAAARALPVAEVVVAISLLLPLYRWAALGAVAMLILYSVAIAINLARGRREIDCGCFGPAAGVPLSGGLVARNVLLIGASALVALPVSTRLLVWVDAFSIIVAVAVTALLWISFWRLSETARLQRGHR